MAMSIYSAKEAEKKYRNDSQIAICVKYLKKKNFLVLAYAILFFALGSLVNRVTLI